ncbi:MAG: hypothetical protein LBT21_01500, partial [Oscillospiraceae bacterium]|nr:hypothetical protein [Oscillospiraceae bacterium]
MATNGETLFNVAKHGYDPEQVERYISELQKHYNVLYNIVTSRVNDETAFLAEQDSEQIVRAYVPQLVEPQQIDFDSEVPFYAPSEETRQDSEVPFYAPSEQARQDSEVPFYA